MYVHLARQLGGLEDMVQRSEDLRSASSSNINVSHGTCPSFPHGGGQRQVGSTRLGSCWFSSRFRQGHLRVGRREVECCQPLASPQILYAGAAHPAHRTEAFPPQTTARRSPEQELRQQVLLGVCGDHTHSVCICDSWQMSYLNDTTGMTLQCDFQQKLNCRNTVILITFLLNRK